MDSFPAVSMNTELQSFGFCFKLLQQFYSLKQKSIQAACRPLPQVASGAHLSVPRPSTAALLGQASRIQQTCLLSYGNAWPEAQSGLNKRI